MRIAKIYGMGFYFSLQIGMQYFILSLIEVEISSKLKLNSVRFNQALLSYFFSEDPNPCPLQVDNFIIISLLSSVLNDHLHDSESQG